MFELTDEERASVGMDPVQPHWRRAEVGPVLVYFEGDTIRKYVSARPDGYLEVDAEIPTRDGTTVLPKSGKGKTAKLTPALLLVRERSKGRWLSIGFGREGAFRVGIRALNPKNMRSLDFWRTEGVGDYATLRAYLARRSASLDDVQRAEIEEMRSAPRQQVKYRPGDIFRFRLDDDRFGFALILGCLKDMRTWKEMAPDHPLHDVMTVPLMVRPLRYVADTPHPDVAALAGASLTPSCLMMDAEVFWGQFPIVAKRPIEAEGVDFPMGCGVSTSRDKFDYFYWGFGLHKGTPTSDQGDDLCGRSIGHLDRQSIQAALDGASPYQKHDLRHADHAELRKSLFKHIGYDGIEDYGAYAAWAGCLTPDGFVANTQAFYARPAGAKKARAPKE